MDVNFNISVYIIYSVLFFSRMVRWILVNIYPHKGAQNNCKKIKARRTDDSLLDSFSKQKKDNTKPCFLPFLKENFYSGN